MQDAFGVEEVSKGISAKAVGDITGHTARKLDRAAGKMGQRSLKSEFDTTIEGAAGPKVFNKDKYMKAKRAKFRQVDAYSRLKGSATASRNRGASYRKQIGQDAKKLALLGSVPAATGTVGAGAGYAVGRKKVSKVFTNKEKAKIGAVGAGGAGAGAAVGSLHSLAYGSPKKKAMAIGAAGFGAGAVGESAFWTKRAKKGKKAPAFYNSSNPKKVSKAFTLNRKEAKKDALTVGSTGAAVGAGIGALRAEKEPAWKFGRSAKYGMKMKRNFPTTKKAVAGAVGIGSIGAVSGAAANINYKKKKKVEKAFNPGNNKKNNPKEMNNMLLSAPSGGGKGTPTGNKPPMNTQAPNKGSLLPMKKPQMK